MCVAYSSPATILSLHRLRLRPGGIFIQLKAIRGVLLTPYLGFAANAHRWLLLCVSQHGLFPNWRPSRFPRQAWRGHSDFGR